MTTQIVLDDKLVADAMRLTKTKTEKKVVDRALRELIATRQRRDIRELRGKNLVDPEALGPPRKQRDIRDLFGQGLIDPDYDYKKLRRGK